MLSSSSPSPPIPPSAAPPDKVSVSTERLSERFKAETSVSVKLVPSAAIPPSASSVLFGFSSVGSVAASASPSSSSAGAKVDAAVAPD